MVAILFSRCYIATKMAEHFVKFQSINVVLLWNIEETNECYKKYFHGVDNNLFKIFRINKLFVKKQISLGEKDD